MATAQKIIGIDPGTRATGFAVIETREQRGSTPLVLDMGVIRLHPSLVWQDRIVSLHDSIKKITSIHQPRLGVIEKAFFGINASSSLKLGEARGAILIALAAYGVETIEVSPTQAKKFIAGAGHASKQQLATAVTNLFRIDLKDIAHDATDALALAFCHHLAGL